jgi:small subunit ribosomal protein S16
MALAMRLSRGGRKSRPFYRIVVADKRMPRDGRYIERLGTYNPLLAKDDENRVKLNEERIKHWLGEGAQPSYRVAVFLGKAGIAPMPEQRNNPQKAEPSEKTKMRIADKEEKKKAQAEAAKAAEEEAKAAAEAEAAAPAEEAPAEDAAPEAEAPAEEAKTEEAPADAPAEEATEEKKD